MFALLALSALGLMSAKPARVLLFHTRLWCMHHVEYSTKACLAAMQSGECEKLSAYALDQTDHVDATTRLAVKKAGKS